MHEKSLIDANNIFLEKHRGPFSAGINGFVILGPCSSSKQKNDFLCCMCAESLMHRAAVAELMYVLEPNKKAEAVKLIEDSVNDLVSL